jgi:hypothetical protein
MKTAGAANSLIAAARKRPVAMPLSKASQAMMPCHPGTLGMVLFAYPVLATAFCELESVCIQGFKRNTTTNNTAIAAKPPATERT